MTLLQLAVEKWAAQNDMSKKQIAYKLNMSQQNLSNKLSGTRCLSLEDAHQFAQLLNTTLDTIYFLAS